MRSFFGRFGLLDEKRIPRGFKSALADHAQGGEIKSVVRFQLDRAFGMFYRQFMFADFLIEHGDGQLSSYEFLVEGQKFDELIDGLIEFALSA